MIHIGNLTIAGPLLLAPIAGYTDSPYRGIARRHGAGLTVTELISADGIVRGGAKTMDLMKFSEEERPLGIQIFGNDPAVMGRAAAVAEGLGPDFIDINFGCPARRVCASGSGAALLLDPERMRAITDSVARSVRLPVTAKIRTGWDRGAMNYRDIVSSLQDGGVSLIAVHGRTRQQMYGGRADWEVIAEISAMAAVPVVGNGDITSYGDGLEKMRRSGCAAVMIGRAAIGNPWIFSGKSPSMEERTSQIREHFDSMLRFYGHKGIILMRKHLVKYIHGMKNASLLRARLVVLKDREEIFSVLDSLAD